MQTFNGPAEDWRFRIEFKINGVPQVAEYIRPIPPRRDYKSHMKIVKQQWDEVFNSLLTIKGFTWSRSEAERVEEA